MCSTFQETLWKRSVGPWVRQFEEPARPKGNDAVVETFQESPRTAQGLLIKRKTKRCKKRYARDTDKDSPHKKKVKYDPSSDKNIQGDPQRTVIVARLAYSTTQKTLAKTFGKHGTVVRHRLVTNVKTGKSRCYAFIEYSEESAANVVCELASKGSGITIDGRKVLVDRVRAGIQDSWLPYRLGGGPGLRKKGNQRFNQKVLI